MTSVRRAVSFPDHDMRMEHWFAILFHDVTSEVENFGLLLQRNLLVAFLLSIKETERHLAESPNGRDLRSSEPLFRGEPH